MFNLTMHSTHFLFTHIFYMVLDIWERTIQRARSMKEGPFLFNDTLNTFFYLWLYGAGQVVREHPDNKRINLMPPHGLHFQLAARGLLYALYHRYDCTYHSLCCSSCGALAVTRTSTLGPPRGIDPMTHHTMSRPSTTELHLISANVEVIFFAQVLN